MQVDGQLKSAQLEEIASTGPSPAARSRMYSDITDTAAAKVRYHDGTAWRLVQTTAPGVKSKSTTYTILSDDGYIYANANSAAFTMTLPTAVGIAGKIFCIQKTDSTLNHAVTLATTGGQTIGGSATTTLNTNGETLYVQSDGTNYQIVERYIPSVWVTFTPTGLWNTNVIYYGVWRRIGDSIDIDISVKVSGGAPNAANLSINYLPGGLTENQSKTSFGQGSGFTYPAMNSFVIAEDFSVPDRFILTAIYGDTDTVDLYKDDGDGTLTAANRTTPFTFADGDWVYMRLNSIPITGWNA